MLQEIAPDRLSLQPKIVEGFLQESRRHFKRNEATLSRLARKYRLGIVSNFYGNLEGVLQSEGLDHFFQTVADSGVVGSQKPEARIFWHALRALGVGPEEA